MFTILTVDDEVMICDLIRDFLTERGYTVWCAYSGEEALEKIARGKPDLVLLDMIMPGMGGEAALKEIKNRYIGLPVIMISVIADEKKARRLLKEGASDYITKPIDFKYLEQNIILWQSMRN